MSGHLALVGLGPGDPRHLTLRAAEVLQACEVVVGYRGYVAQVGAWFPSEARVEICSELGEESRRAGEAIRHARAGRRVALVSSGDPSIYGMGGPLFALLARDGWDARAPDPPVEVVPGVTAALSAGAMLGAPLADDLALVSLSDVLAPWSLIEERLDAAARGDFVIALYNPASQRRRSGIVRAREILLRHRPADTPVALVRGALRADGQSVLSTLGAFLEECPFPDMQTLVLVGNRRTERFGDYLVAVRALPGEAGVS